MTDEDAVQATNDSHAAQEGRVLILTSSVKLTTHMFENMCMGSSIMSLDHNERSMKFEEECRLCH